MVHGVCDDLAAVLDKLDCFLREFIVNVHVVNVCCGIESYIVAGKLPFVIKVWPVGELRNDICYRSQLFEFGESIEEEGIDHLS